MLFWYIWSSITRYFHCTFLISILKSGIVYLGVEESGHFILFSASSVGYSFIENSVTTVYLIFRDVPRYISSQVCIKGKVYQVYFGWISSCEEGKRISWLWEEYNIEKRIRGSNIIFPIILRIMGRGKGFRDITL